MLILLKSIRWSSEVKSTNLLVRITSLTHLLPPTAESLKIVSREIDMRQVEQYSRSPNLYLVLLMFSVGILMTADPL